MAKNRLAKDQDKVIVRLPDGMRDRIKAAAVRHEVSMNEEIVNCLVRFFPPPKTVAEEAYVLKEKLKVLRQGASVEELASLNEELHEFLTEIMNGHIKAPDGVQGKVKDALIDHEIDMMKETSPYPAGEDE